MFSHLHGRRSLEDWAAADRPGAGVSWVAMGEAVGFGGAAMDCCCLEVWDIRVDRGVGLA